VSKIEKTTAAYCLDDEISAVQVNLDKAETVLQALTNDFFQLSPKDENGIGVLWEFKRAGTFADIAQDYLFKCRGTIEQLNKLANEGSDIARQEKANSEDTLIKLIKAVLSVSKKEGMEQ